MSISETEMNRLRRQRDNAWRALAGIEKNLGKMDEPGLAFFLAGAIDLEDLDEWDTWQDAHSLDAESVD